MRRGLFAQAGPLMLGRGVAAALGFTLPLVLARRFTLGEYGTYKQIFLVSNTAFWVLQLGMAQALYYFVPRAADALARRQFVLHSYLFLALSGALAALGLVLFADPLSAVMSNPDLAPLVPLTAAYTWLLVATSPLEIQLTAEGRVGAAGVALVVTEVLRVGLSVGLLLAGGGLRGFLVGSVIATGLRAALCVALVAARGVPRPSWPRLKEQLAYALPFGAAILLAIPQQQLHLYAVSLSFDPATFAIYATGCFQIPLINLLYSPVSDVLQVRLAETADRAAQLALFHEAVGKLAFFFFPLCVGLVAAAPELVEALFTNRYRAAIPIFRIAVLAVPLAALPLDGVLRARGRTRYLFLQYLWKLALSAPAVFVGLKFGLVGVIVSVTLVEAGSRVAMLREVGRELGAGARELLPWRDLGGFAWLSVACCAVVWALQQLRLERPLLALALECGVYGLAYLALAAGVPHFRRRGLVPSFSSVREA